MEQQVFYVAIKALRILCFFLAVCFFAYAIRKGNRNR
jgi:cbb3-type cytochrome oxidase subunit 3